MTGVLARFKCTEVAEISDGTERVEMSPVYSSDEDHPNRRFWEASPSGSFMLRITEEGAQGFFEVGREYDFRITPVEEE